MNTKDLTLSQTEIHKLLSAGSGDAALLHLYLQCGNAPREAEAALGVGRPVLLRRRYPSAAGPLAGGSVYLPPRPGRAPPVREDVTQAMNRQRGISPPGGGGCSGPWGGFSPAEAAENPPVLPELPGPARRGG